MSSIPLRIVRDSKHEPWGTPTPGIMVKTGPVSGRVSQPLCSLASSSGPCFPVVIPLLCLALETPRAGNATGDVAPR